MQKMNGGKNTKKFLFFKDEGNLHKRGHGRNISDDRGYGADGAGMAWQESHQVQWNSQNNKLMIQINTHEYE